MKIRNSGAGSARRISVSLSASAELTATAGVDADGKSLKASGADIQFPVIDELPQGKSVILEATLTGAKAGVARLRGEVRADHLKQVLHEEQTVRVTGEK